MVATLAATMVVSFFGWRLFKTAAERRAAAGDADGEDLGMTIAVTFGTALCLKQ